MRLFSACKAENAAGKGCRILRRFGYWGPVFCPWGRKCGTKCRSLFAAVGGKCGGKFGVFLHNNKFWDAQIEQIHVLPDRNIELVPRVGDHLVYLGKLDDFEDKLARLKEFYKKGLNKVGWNKYSRINLEFSNQIICTKRER